LGQNAIDYNLSGEWVGILNQNSGYSYSEFGMSLKLNQSGDNLTGTIKFTRNADNIDVYVVYNVSGRIDRQENKFYLFDENIVDEFGQHAWCKKNYQGKIIIENNIITSITGNWENDRGKLFEYKVLKEGGNCSPGKFTIRTPQQEEIFKQAQVAKAKEAARVAKEQEVARQKEAEKEERMQTIYDSLFKSALRKVKAHPAATTKIIATYKGYSLRAIVDIDKLISVNACHEKGESKSEAAWKDIDRLNQTSMLRVMEMRYSFSFNPTKYEPHERDAAFATRYLTVKKINELLLEAAARYNICDTKTANELIDQITKGEPTDVADEDEFDRMVKYLKSK
jgi:hypothetical protein